MKPKFRQKLLGKLNWLDPERVQDYFSQLAREKGFFEAVFDSLAEGVIVTNHEGRISYLNQAATELLGVPQETALGLALRRYLPDLKWDATGNGKPRVFSREIEVFYPQQRYLHLHAVPLTAAGGGTVLILRDVTAARKQTANTIATERNEAVSLLAAGVAHEIGNPLNSLNIHLQLLDRELRHVPAERRAALKESVRVAKAEVARLDKIISDFLRAARPTPPRLALESLNAVVEDTLQFMSAEIQGASVAAEVNLSRGLPRVWLDHDQMKQVFINLIKNALQAMKPGGKLAVATERTEEFVIVNVTDTGAGIAPHLIGKIFEPYESTKQGGSGLGLMIVRRIVQQHGGAIDVDSAVGKGTVFRVRLPTPERRARVLEAPSGTTVRQLEAPAGN
ncbi:MAG: PAS domain-containing protein [Verrucomicrobia bacterium]|nr:PAS domain-containing protein [Verrucomicrobiota bacterium]